MRNFSLAHKHKHTKMFLEELKLIILIEVEKNNLT